MDLKQLRIFLNVADTGSLSKAAERLNVTQPALSRQIRMMEMDAGTPLFIRTGRGVLLSEAGRKLEPRARLLSEEMERLKMDMTAFAGTVSGEVRLGLPPSVGIILAGPLIEEFRSQYPHVKLRVTQMLSGILQENLLNGRLDLAVLFEGNISPLLHCEPLWSERLYLITRDKDAFKDKKTISLNDCFDLPMILPGPKHSIRAELERKSQAQQKELSVIVEADSLSIQSELVCRGLGSTISSYAAYKDYIESGKLFAIPIENPEMNRITSLVWSRDYPLTRAAQCMADSLKETAGKIFTLL
jgi:LysR family nitrogen assimilation transcriptional regulator